MPDFLIKSCNCLFVYITVYSYIYNYLYINILIWFTTIVCIKIHCVSTLLKLTDMLSNVKILNPTGKKYFYGF